MLVLLSFGAFGQQAFEVASVKPVKAGQARGPSFLFTQGGGLQVTNGTLKGLIEMAYDVRDFQISGGPGWVNSEGYDIVAKSASGNPDGAIPETRRKLQGLLMERFQLSVHRETKELPIYALAVGKNGSKLAEAGAAGGTNSGIRTDCGQMTGMKATMTNLAYTLSRQLSHPVLDRTSLTGKYDFQLVWTPDTACPAPTEGPSIFTALQEQLGLKLETTKGPVEIIVIDRAEKAAAN